jgi:putative hemolysin
MFRKILLSLFMLIGMLSLAFCTSQQASPIPEANLASPTPQADMAGPSPLANIANPASVYCEKNGGKPELRQDASGGVAGVCIFPDGSECDEWAYFRGECKPGDSLAKPVPATAPVGALRIVYFKDGQVMSWTEGKGPKALAKASTEQVRISDDGQVVAYLGTDSAGSYGLYGVNADGTNPRQLVGQESLQSKQIVSFDFAPGAHTLYFVTDQYDLQRVDTEDGSAVQILGAGKGGFFSFSPDGQWMVLYHPNELVLVKPDGTAARTVFQYPPEFSYTMVGPEIAWKADSSGFNLVSASGPQGEADSMTVWFIPVSGEPVKQMSYAGPYGANLAPDGQTVVYLNFQHEPVDVHIVDAEGKDSTYGTYSSQTTPAIKFMGWAPDSKSFLLNLSKDGRMMEPYLCMTGKSPVKLIDTQYASQVVWVDAERILFISDGGLRMQETGKASVVLDAVSSSSFDFALTHP